MQAGSTLGLVCASRWSPHIWLGDSCFGDFVKRSRWWSVTVKPRSIGCLPGLKGYACAEHSVGHTRTSSSTRKPKPIGCLPKGYACPDHSVDHTRTSSSTVKPTPIGCLPKAHACADHSVATPNIIVHCQADTSRLSCPDPDDPASVECWCQVARQWSDMLKRRP